MTSQVAILPVPASATMEIEAPQQEAFRRWRSIRLAMSLMAFWTEGQPATFIHQDSRAYGNGKNKLFAGYFAMEETK